ncbi:MAG: hypothetical protein IPN36_12585 [Bacteroidetes bacterium]|nr:hypothetical protein [Bacteroidota bacterium]
MDNSVLMSAIKSQSGIIIYPILYTRFTHNTWLNDAGTVLFTTDENTNSYLGAYDITNLNNIIELDRIQLTPGSGSIIHNTHTLNDFEIASWYKDGIAIVGVRSSRKHDCYRLFRFFSQGIGNGLVEHGVFTLIFLRVYLVAF